MQYDVVVIGGGPAGLFCAIHAAAFFRVLLLEKNRQPGAKLLLAGSGQCNITHDGEIRAFVPHYGNHGKFLQPALLSFTNRDLMDFFHTHGLELVPGENGKIFPATRRSSDVLAILIARCREQGVTLRYSETVTGISRQGGAFLVATGTDTYEAPVVVITTGGASYPRCGTTGDGYRFAAMLGQPVTDITPALTPLQIRPFPFASLAGITLAGTRFSVWRAGGKISVHTGDVLITHGGLSGPGILDASRHIRAGDEIRLSFTGPLPPETFVAGLAQQVQENPGRLVSTVLAGYPVPERVRRVLLERAGIPHALKCANLSAARRRALAGYCTAFPLTVAAPGDFSIAMATCGGVALDWVQAKTMESTIIPGLFFAGEVLDIDGDTGGYNLQAAFSTGYLAAEGIRKHLALCR